MRVGDDSPLLPRSDAAPRATPNDQRWLADLERAWLQNWQSEASGPSAAQPPSRGSRASSEATARDTLAGMPEEASATALAQPGVLAPLSGTAGTARVSSGLTNVHSTAGPLRAAGATLSDAHQPPGTPPSIALAGGLAGAASTHAVAQRNAAPPAGPLTQPPPTPSARPVSDAAPLRMDAVAWAVIPLKAQGAVFKVALSDSTAQVTLRDASLAAGDSARVGEAIAGQLGGFGFTSMRVYVNGKVTHHVAPRESGRSTVVPDLPRVIDTLQRTPFSKES